MYFNCQTTRTSLDACSMKCICMHMMLVHMIMLIASQFATCREFFLLYLYPECAYYPGGYNNYIIVLNWLFLHAGVTILPSASQSTMEPSATINYSTPSNSILPTATYTSITQGKQLQH